MIYLALTLGVNTLAASAPVDPAVRVAGTYSLIPNAEMRSFCRRHRVDVPYGQLTLREDRSFGLSVVDDAGQTKSSGYFDVDGNEIHFVVNGGTDYDLPVAMQFDGNVLRGQDTTYSRDSSDSVREVPTPAPAQPVAPAGFNGSIAGAWRLKTNSGIDHNTVFSFTSDGMFHYRGSSSSSDGRYVVRDGSIDLVWTAIDGEPVGPDSYIHKRLPLTTSGDAFYVDAYRYERS